MVEYQCLYGLDKQWLSVLYLNEAEELMRYDVIKYQSAEAVALEIEQIEHGQNIEVNGRMVYLAENTANMTATWHEEITIYTLFAPASIGSIIDIIELIE